MVAELEMAVLLQDAAAELVELEIIMVAAVLVVIGGKAEIQDNVVFAVLVQVAVRGVHLTALIAVHSLIMAEVAAVA